MNTTGNGKRVLPEGCGTELCFDTRGDDHTEVSHFPQASQWMALSDKQVLLDPEKPFSESGKMAMRELTDLELDLVAGGDGRAEWTYTYPRTTTFDSAGAIADLSARVSSHAAAGMAAPGPVPVRVAGAVGGAMVGAYFSMRNVGAFSSPVIPSVTITEMAPGSQQGQGGGSE
jgi:hypothetical protein